MKLKVDGRIGIVVENLPGAQYQVFLSADDQPIVAENALETIQTEHKFVDGRNFLRDLLLFKLRRPLSDTLYSYSASRTNFEVYQFKPVVKFVNNPTNRILIADEVGLGKTIEACLIYLELKARVQGNLPRVLIVCPAGLTRKWRDELYSRFGEQFDILDGNLLDQFFGRWELDRSGATLKGICSLERLRREQVVQKITDLNVEFDLVIVDEAHHMRNPEARSFDLGELLSARSDALVLLTATPVQLRALDLFYLLNIMEPGEFESPELFEQQLEPNRFLNRAIKAASGDPPEISQSIAELNRIPSFIKGNPYFVEAIGLLNGLDKKGGAALRSDLVLALRSLHKLNTLSHIFNRSRRAEIGGGSTRVANVVSVDLSELERRIYDTALNFARAKIQRRNTVFPLGLIQIERQIASSIGAYKIIVDDFARGNRTAIEIDESSDDLDSTSVIETDDVYELAGELQSLYRQLGDRDSKFEKFHEELNRLSRDHKKIIVFSFFKRTLEYLRRRLRDVGYSVEVIHGDISPLNRQPILEEFQHNPDKHILLSSEVGAEGQDFQFCDVIVNYDLPWNPMRVEQRIGRIDRYGQASDQVTVVSFFLQGTIEERILMRLYDRIGIFKESIGELEPILGEIVKELSYEAVSKDLSPQQQAQLLEQHLRSLEHKKSDLREFENNRIELIGHDQIFSNEVEESITSGRYVSANEISSLCLAFLSKRCPGTRLEPLKSDDKRFWKFVPDVVFKTELDRFLGRPGSRGGAVDREFHQKVLDGSARGVPMTFDSDMAHQRHLLQFVNIWHPLARMATEFFNGQDLSQPEQRVVRTRFSTANPELHGDYRVFLFSIASEGVVATHELVSVMVDEQGEISRPASVGFLKALQDAPSFEPMGQSSQLSPDEFDRAKRLAHQHMGDVRTEKEESSRQRNEALLQVRKSAIERTYESKIRRAQNRLERAQDQRIIRMHQGEIRNLGARLSFALEELEARKEVSVTYETVAFGEVQIRAHSEFFMEDDEELDC
ncbi:MAG: helicase-related protein [Verrucomicrobia bacterium]|nr:helicase-related protein [Verrucomicrobiota bacterium]